MSAFRLTKAARADLRAIGRYTRDRWGHERARRYLQGLDACFRRLVDDPGAGQVHPDVPPYRRLLQGRHAVFYRVIDDGFLLVVRVVHARMLPELYLPSRGGDDEKP
jgi:toxin ParE1/3/4